MKAWAVVEAKAPLQRLDLPMPEPTGREVLIEVTHCGLCHSDLHFCEGEYPMGGGRVLKLADRGVTLPRAPGHEILGKVAGFGPDAEGVAIGDVRVVYPWIGCGHCPACLAEHDNLCTGGARSLGVMQNGGFASHVLVRDARYLVDPGGVDPALAATYACSGITAHGAVQKIMPLDGDDPVVLIGAGGLGLTAVAMLRAFGHRRILCLDTTQDKLDAALAAGATDVVLAGPDQTDAILHAAGGPVAAVIDFVNVSVTARAAIAVLRKGGKLVVVGVGGGELALSLSEIVFRALTIQGTLMGSPQDLRDVIALANAGKLAATPITCVERSGTNDAIGALARGDVTGRLVLTGAF